MKVPVKHTPVKVPDDPGELRAFCARWRISRRAVGEVYGCSGSFISEVLHGYPCSTKVWNRVRNAVREVFLSQWEDGHVRPGK